MRTRKSLPSLLPVLLVLIGLAEPGARAQCPSAWSPTIGAGTTNGIVLDLVEFDDGSGGGSKLYASGYFTILGGVAANRVACWDGNAWSPLGLGCSGPVFALAVFDDGSGPALYAAGYFQTAGGQLASNIARWDGTTWSALSSGIGGSFAHVNALAVHDDGTGFGRALYVGGDFSSAGGLPANRIARFSASGWSVPGGLGSSGGAEVYALGVFDPGSGAQLYAGGWGFGMGYSLVQRWDGATWSDLPAGGPVDIGLYGSVESLCVFDDGSGPSLYVAGDLQDNANVRRFDGTSWSYFGSVTYNDKYTHVYDMTVHDDGTGPALWITGEFQFAGDFVIADLARWNGQSWSVPATGLPGTGRYGHALASHDDGAGSALFVGGGFDNAGGVPASCIARLEANGGIPSVAAPTGPASAVVGETLQLSVAASGAGPLTYQWRKTGYNSVSNEGGPVVGSTTSTVTLEIVSNHLADGIYSVVVRGPCGATAGPGHLLSVQNGPGVPLCNGHTGCPCNNWSVSNSTQGCRNSLGENGWLAAQGTARIAQDSLVLLGQNMTNGSVLYFQGTTSLGNGAVFGDGKRCAAGTVRRLAVKQNVNGASRFPDAGDGLLSQVGGITLPATRVYQAWYRDAVPFCTSAAFNLTNGVSVIWSP